MKIDEVFELPECPENCETGVYSSCLVKRENGYLSRCAVLSRKFSLTRFSEILKISDIELEKPVLRADIKDVPNNHRKEILDVYHYLETGGSQRLIISPFGTGKSMLLYVLLFELLCAGEKPFYVKADVLKKGICAEIMGTPPPWLSQFRNASFLLIDDFALETVSAQATYFEEKLCSLLESPGKRIIWATNWNITDIQEKYKSHGPLVDRLKLLKVVKWGGKSMRCAK